MRARALSTLAGVFRGGWAIGPFIAAALIAWTGSPEVVFWVLVVGCFAVVVGAAACCPTPNGSSVPRSSRARHPRMVPVRTAGEAEADAASHGVFRAIVTYRGVLLRIGSGVGLLAAVRASRTVILPLWAVSIGMPPETAALVIGVSATVDFALFYVSGQVMDRFGRLWSAIPGLVGLGIGLFVLALTHDVPGAEAWFTGVALLFGIANGLSSGVILTLGADLAPQANPAPFLAAFRTIGDAGGAAAPLILAGGDLGGVDHGGERDDGRARLRRRGHPVAVRAALCSAAPTRPAAPAGRRRRVALRVAALVGAAPLVAGVN